MRVMHSGRVPKLQILVFILLLNLKSKNKKKYNHCLENGLPPLAVFSVEQEPAIEYGPMPYQTYSRVCLFCPLVTNFMLQDIGSVKLQLKQSEHENAFCLAIKIYHVLIQSKSKYKGYTHVALASYWICTAMIEVGKRVHWRLNSLLKVSLQSK